MVVEVVVADCVNVSIDSSNSGVQNFSKSQGDPKLYKGKWRHLWMLLIRTQVCIYLGLRFPSAGGRGVTSPYPPLIESPPPEY